MKTAVRNSKTEFEKPNYIIIFLSSVGLSYSIVKTILDGSISNHILPLFIISFIIFFRHFSLLIFNSKKPYFNKNLFKSFIPFLSLFAINHGNAVAQMDKSLLWEISGNGLSKPSYLYGTIHMMCEKDFLMKEKVKSAFKQSEELVLELDYDDQAEIMDMQKLAISDKKLSETLSKGDYEKLDTFLKEKIGAGASQFENMSMTAIMSVIMMKSLNCPPKMYEIEFLKMAMGKKIQTQGLEKVKEQFALLESAYTNEEIIKQLPYFDVSYFNELVKLYNEENLDGIYKFLSDERFMNETIMKNLLTERNANWVKIMPHMMHQKPTFFAVGAAHLIGKNGVINLLKDAGFTVKPLLD